MSDPIPVELRRVESSIMSRPPTTRLRVRIAFYALQIRVPLERSATRRHALTSDKAERIAPQATRSELPLQQ